MRFRATSFSFLIILLFASIASAQTARPDVIVPQGSSIPGLMGLPGNQAPGFIELGGARARLTSPNPDWSDMYARTAMNVSERNQINGEISRQNRFGDSGWYYVLGLTHVFSSNVYASGFAGMSTGGFFLPKYRTDGFINFKMLPRKQLVANLGVGYDKSKSVNSAMRYQVGATYYFERPFILQGGLTVTNANPGSQIAKTGNLAITQGREKSHYITFRYETGREAYEITGPSNAIVNFPIHVYDITWRQWVGNNWGINSNFEREVNNYYNRNLARVGVFLDF